MRNLEERLNLELYLSSISFFQLAPVYRQVLAENGVPLCHYFNPGDNAIQASCTRRALQRPVPGQDAILDHRLMQGVLCDKARRCVMTYSWATHSYDTRVKA